MCADMKKSIPERAFGTCRWCGAESVTLTYLMCPDCNRISNLIPSKAMVLINNPQIKRKLASSGLTIRTLAPHLHEFIANPESKFPPEKTDLEHWQTLLEYAPDQASDDDVKNYVSRIMDSDAIALPTKEEARQNAGVEVILRFMMLVGLVRGVLRIKMDEDDASVIERILEEENISEAPPARSMPSSRPGSPAPQPEASKRSGMHSARRGGR